MPNSTETKRTLNHSSTVMQSPSRSDCDSRFLLSSRFLRGCLLACACLFVCVCLLANSSRLLAADVSFETSEHAVKVLVDGQHFTTYLFHYGIKPVFWPIYGPTQAAMTRAYPMQDPKMDSLDSFDHIHQRSLWLTHGDVNGVDFWTEANGSGVIQHSEFVKIEAPTLVTRNRWMKRDGTELLLEERTMTFGADQHGRWIDLDSKLTAVCDSVVFGDTKEGTLGLRVPGVLDVDKKKGGRIVNSEGLTDADAWGKQAAWVDYNGVIDGKPVGIAIMNHPGSFRYPTYWHVRTYGLFAANPFGQGAFTHDRSKPGTYELKKGESLTLRYRLYFHEGNEKTAGVADVFRQYSGQP